MTVVETVLVFGGIPLAITAVLAIAIFGRSALQQPNRYRPGKPWNYPPVWYVPHPDALTEYESARLAIEGALSGSTGATAVGGADGEW